MIILRKLNVCNSIGVGRHQANYLVLRRHTDVDKSYILVADTHSSAAAQVQLQQLLNQIVTKYSCDFNAYKQTLESSMVLVD